MASTVYGWQVPSSSIPWRFDFPPSRTQYDFPLLGTDSHIGADDHGNTKVPHAPQHQETPDANQFGPAGAPRHGQDLHRETLGTVPHLQQQIEQIEPTTASNAPTQTKTFQFSTLGRSIPKNPSNWEEEDAREVSPPSRQHYIARKPVAAGESTIRPATVDVPKLSIQTKDLDRCLEEIPRHPELPKLIPIDHQHVENNGNGDDDSEAWQKNEIPEELGYFNADEPEAIRNIVQESLDEHRALRASRMHAQAIVVRTTITMSTAGSRASTILPLVESTAMSPNQSPELMFARDHLDSQILARGSTSTVGSSVDEHVLHNLRSSPELVSSSSYESLGSSAGSSAIGIARKGRSRNQGLFRLLPGLVNRKAKRPSPADETPIEAATSECTSCFDDIPFAEAVDVPCRHQYCSTCFSQLVTTAILNEDTFPPKCCLQDIPRRVLQLHLSPKELEAFDEKELEYAVPSESRYYCGSTSCAKWIDTRKALRSDGALQCPHCRFKMCTSCRGAQHGRTQDCPQDFDLGAALRQAERAGWRRCYSCRTMVELNRGCRHITCKCRAEFW